MHKSCLQSNLLFSQEHTLTKKVQKIWESYRILQRGGRLGGGFNAEKKGPIDESHCLCKICKDKGKCSCGSLIGKNVIELKKLTELLEVTPEILVDDDEVSEIENQRFFYRNKQKGTLSKWCNERQSKPRKKERCLRQLFDK